ncbi:trypsin 3A1-like [Anopheles ziemanni]|uniref:trypsin 3A1-like n=1 Tax=Anopheles coustani TaxID=139045 RepID=UPI00265B07E9|nr:trypsin 3A1-like [Anopheles coustani]XP_058170046.1 trypsin 3A1-like [Anopheles ziemanni]
MKQAIGTVCLVYLFGCALAQSQSESDSKRGFASGRVVNGTTVSIEDYPFLVRLRYAGRFFCGASVITSKHALTAAHCLFFEPDAADLELFGGSSDASNGTTFSVSSYSIHPQFKYENANNDAAIVTIVGTFADHRNIAAIPLQTTELRYSSNNPTWCFVAGWGYTNGKVVSPSQTLQLGWTPLVSQYSCQQMWGRRVTITPQMICAKLQNMTSCRGDSGGPLVCNGQLTGIVSLGDLYCTGRLPSIFTRVDSNSVREFISIVTASTGNIFKENHIGS